MPTFDEILTGKGYHCEYYGKWHSLTSHAEVYKNPVERSEKWKVGFGHGGQKFVHLDFLDENFPVRDLEPGELYDKMSGRPYITDPLDKHHGMTDDELKASNEKYPQCDMHGELQIPKEYSLNCIPGETDH